MKAQRILVVEDERIIALHLRQQLTKLGYDVPDAVASGDHALRGIEEARPDLVLMDINLKGTRDGIATAAAIPPAYRIPVIYLTAYSADATLERAAATNPYGYLLKPFSERELHAMIQVTLARCEAERAFRAELECRHHAQKMQALSHLAGGVADEFGDLLTGLRDQLEVMGSRAAVEPGLAGPIQDTFRATVEKERLVQQLLDFSGRRELFPLTVSVTDLVTGMLRHLRQLVGDTVRIWPHLPDQLWNVRIDAGQLARALTNLTVNAREAMPNGGALTIECQNAVLGHAGTAGSRYVLLSLTDTGTGMPEQVMERAFEPFFTTKPDGRGSGLGLSLVCGFVRQSGGHISIDSNPGIGTTVRVHLPAAPAGDRTCSDRNDQDLHTDTDPVADHVTTSQTDIVSKAIGVTRRQRGGQGARSMPIREHDASTVLWHKAENALFASVLVARDPFRRRLIVEPLPRGIGFDWAVWRPGATGESSRHGRASSIVSAMAAAEDAARHWD